MAKEEFRGDVAHGLEIEIAGEVREDEVQAEAEELAEVQAEVLAEDLWGLSPVERGRSRWLAWRSTTAERLRSRWREARGLLTWRVAAWVAGAALLGFGIGALTEPSAKQLTVRSLSTDFDLHFDNQPITAPGQAQMAGLVGAAWSISPVTTLTVHVVNDGSTALRLHNGTLSGARISRGTLVPDGSGVLAPGQHGTLTARVAVSCANAPTDAVEGPTARPLTADIPVSTATGPATVVQLISGSTQDDLYIASQLCAGLPTPLTMSIQEIPGVAAQGGPSIQITVHNITDQRMRYSPELMFQPVDIDDMQTIAAGATVVINIPLAQICPTSSQVYISPTAGLYMSTMDGSYQTSHAVDINTDPRLSAACYG